MRNAKDYIIFPLDVASDDEAKRYVELLADRVGLFKVGLELFIRSGPEIVRFINSAGSAGVFLDLKLHEDCSIYQFSWFGRGVLGFEAA
jgi:orotidine-5'-phosphate decarboxylase